MEVTRISYIFITRRRIGCILLGLYVYAAALFVESAKVAKDMAARWWNCEIGLLAMAFGMRMSYQLYRINVLSYTIQSLRQGLA